MFCYKCGVKLPEKADKCPSCGEPVTGNEYCGGFWGLVKGNKSQLTEKKAVAAEDNYRGKPNSKTDNKPSDREIKMLNKYRQNTKKLLIVSAALMAVVIVELVIIVIFLTGMGSKPETEPSENTGISETENNGIIGGENFNFGYKESDNNEAEVNNYYSANITEATDVTENTENNTTEEFSEEETSQETSETENNGFFHNNKKDDIDNIIETGGES